MRKPVVCLSTITVAALLAVNITLALGATRLDPSSTPGPMWATAFNLSDNAGTSSYPIVAVDKLGNVHVLWYDNSWYPYQDYAFYYRVRNPSGIWSPVTIVSG